MSQVAQGAAPSLTDRTMNALAWRLFATVSQVVLQTFTMVVLARLLSVAEFGMVSQVMIVVGFAGVIAEIGMAPALVQRAELTDKHIRVAFTLSVLSGLVLTLILQLSAYPAAHLLGKNDAGDLVPLLRVISWTFLLASFGSTAGALLERRLEFRKVAMVELVSYATGFGLVAVALAYMGYGEWALVWGWVITALVKTVLLLVISPHALRPCLAPAEAHQLLHFGMGVGVARIANYIAHSGGNFVVGRWLGPEPLGLFVRAYQLMTLPIYHLANALSTVLFPAYSKLQGDPKRMATVYMSSVTLTALVLFPILTVIGIVAPELVRGLFGAKWAGAIIPLQILCGAGWLRTMTNLGDTVARSQGLVYKQALRHCIYAFNVVVGALLTYRWGINGVSVGVFVAVVIHYVLISHLAVIASGVPWKDYLSCQLPGVVMAAVISLATAPVTIGLRATGLNDLLILAATIATAAVSGVAAGILLPGQWLGEVPKEAIRMLQRKLGGRVRFFHLDP